MKTTRTLLFGALALLTACGMDTVAGPQPSVQLDAATLNAGRQPITDTPSFTPFDQAPRVMNRDEVAQALEIEYPALLRGAGVGGRAIVWIQLDEGGVLRRTAINQSSGHQALDEAALRVAQAMKFSPALLKDAPTAVWVSIPISFQVR
jgi:protein TonB